MRITKEMAQIKYWEASNDCHIEVIDGNMSAKEREKVTVLEFPKVIRHNGKSWKVDRITFYNSQGYRIVGSFCIKDYYFPNLNLVRIPRGVSYNLGSYCTSSIEFY